MNNKFQFQDPGEGIHEAEVREVLVSAGDKVQEGQDLLVVETDKAAFEVSSPRSGEVESVVVSAGDTIQAGDTLLTFGDAGDGEESRAGRTGGTPAQASGTKDSAARSAGGTDEQTSAGASSDSDEQRASVEREGDEADEGERAEETRARARARDEGDERERDEATGASVDEGLAKTAAAGKPPVPATPATRRLARELGVELAEVEPSGEAGRVLDEDVRGHAQTAGSGERPERRRGKDADRAVAEESREGAGKAATMASSSRPQPDFSDEGPVERQRLRSVRKKTAERVARAWSEIPHVTHHDLIDITELEQLRKSLAPRVAERGGKLTLTVLVLKALCANLREYPRFNATLDVEQGDVIIKRYYNIGLAVDTQLGLLVPKLKDAASKDLMTLACELTELANRTREGKAKRDELTGGTFTITNVGSLGGTGFTPIINYPEVAILGLARAYLRATVVEHDQGREPQVAARLMLPVSLAFDHRVIDGAEAARFVTRLAERLSNVEEFTLSV